MITWLSRVKFNSIFPGIRPSRRISTVLPASMIILAVLTFVLGFLAYTQVVVINNIIRETLRQSDSRYISVRMQIECLTLSDLLHYYILQTRPDDKVRVKVFIAQSSRRIFELFAQARKTFRPEEYLVYQKAWKEKVKPFLAQANALVKVFDQEKEYGPLTKAAVLKLNVLRAPMFDAFRVVEDMQTERRNQEREKAREVTQRALFIIVFGGGTILAIAIVIAWVNTRMILRPLQEIQLGVEAVSRRQFGKPLQVLQKDEFGDLARAFNNMMAQLRDLIGTLEEKVNDRTRQLSESNESLRKEIADRNRAEEELRRAYEKLKLAQEQLLQSRKMAAIGQLSAGIAHEIKNPLAVISLGAEMLEEKITDADEETQQKLNAIKDAAVRANRIVLEVLRFSHSASVDLGPIDMAEVVRSMITLVENSGRIKDIEIQTEYDESRKFLVIGDANLLGQVISNLIINAIDAIEGHGEIKIRMWPETGEGPDAKKTVALEISDNGCGISADVLPQVFDPFFTTKDPGKGTGLGLSTVYMIVERHNGAIKIDSQKGKGTKVEIRLPAADDAAASFAA